MYNFFLFKDEFAKNRIEKFYIFASLL